MRVFELDKQFSAEIGPQVVASECIERSEQDCQRDIFDSHRHRVFSLAFYMTAHELQAETILTETFIDAFNTASRPDAGIIDASLVERLRRYFPLERPEEPAQADEGSALNGRNVRRTDLEEALQELPACERLVFLLRDVESYTPDAIAPLVGQTPQSVSRILLSARIRLRNALSAAHTRSQAA